jgi:hypothetical protein
VKAIAVPGHGGITAILPKIMEAAGKAPGSVITGGYDISAAALDGLRKGYISVVVDQQPYLQGFMPVVAADVFVTEPAATPSGAPLEPFNTTLVGIDLASGRPALRFARATGSLRLSAIPALPSRAASAMRAVTRRTARMAS